MSLYEYGPERAFELTRTGVEFAESRGLGQQAYFGRFEQLKSLFDLGAWDDLMRTGEEMLAWEHEHDATSVRAALLGYTGLALFFRGDTAAAHRRAEEALPIGRASEDAQMLVPAITLAALLQKESGNLETALALVEELWRLTEPEPMTRSTCLPDMVRICVAAGATELAGDLVEETRKPARRASYAVQASVAILAEQAQALLGIGRCLLELGEPVAGASRLGEARSIFARLGAQRLVDETDDLLAEATALSS